MKIEEVFFCDQNFYWSSFVPFWEKGTKKFKKARGRSCFGWTLLTWWASPLLPSYLAAPETGSTLTGNLCKDPGWKHTTVVSQSVGQETERSVSFWSFKFRRKDPLLEPPSYFLAQAMRSIKEVLKLFFLFPSFHTYAGHKESVNSTLWMKNQVYCVRLKSTS